MPKDEVGYFYVQNKLFLCFVVVFEGLFQFSPDAFTILFVVFVFAPVFEGVIVKVVFVVVELAVGVEVDFDMAEAIVLSRAVV